MSRRFSVDKITVNKQEVRNRLYDDVRDLLRRPSSFGMLAGGAPKEEIDCIRLRFFRPVITAFDLSAEAVEAARVCGVDAVHGNIVHAKTMGEREFDFFNLDLCKTLSTSARVIQQVAMKTCGAMSVFVSFGHGGGDENERAAARVKAVTSQKTTKVAERVRANETTSARERVIFRKTTNGEERVGLRKTTSCVERVNVAETTMLNERVTLDKTTKNVERANGLETTNTGERATNSEFFSLPNTQLGRVLLLHDIVCEVRPEAQIVRVYVYRGNAMMMLGVLFSFAKKTVQALPPFCTVKEESTTEREYQLRCLGLGGRDLRTRLKNGQKEAKRRKSKDNQRTKTSQLNRDNHKSRTR